MYQKKKQQQQQKMKNSDGHTIGATNYIISIAYIDSLLTKANYLLRSR